MNFNCTISIGDIINIVISILTFIGLIFAVIELKQNKNINRANLVKELYLGFYENEDILEVFYDIEYDEYPNCSTYDEELHHSEYGKKVDKLLSFFEVVCNLYYRKMITTDDLSIFSYEMLRVFNNAKIQKYLSNVKLYQTNVNCGFSYINYKKYCNEICNFSIK